MANTEFGVYDEKARKHGLRIGWRFDELTASGPDDLAWIETHDQLQVRFEDRPDGGRGALVFQHKDVGTVYRFLEFLDWHDQRNAKTTIYSAETLGKNVWDQKPAI